MIELKKVHKPFLPFNDWTPDLKRYFLNFLDVSDLCALCQTSHEMKTITYGASTEWKMPQYVRDKFCSESGVL